MKLWEFMALLVCIPYKVTSFLFRYIFEFFTCSIYGPVHFRTKKNQRWWYQLQFNPLPCFCLYLLADWIIIIIIWFFYVTEPTSCVNFQTCFSADCVWSEYLKKEKQVMFAVLWAVHFRGDASNSQIPFNCEYLTVSLHFKSFHFIWTISTFLAFQSTA